MPVENVYLPQVFQSSFCLGIFFIDILQKRGLLPPISTTSYGDNAVGINDLEEFVLYFETEELKSGRGICLGSIRLSLELRRDVVLLLLLFFVMLPGLLAGYCLVPLAPLEFGIGFLGVLFMPGAILLSLLFTLLFECVLGCMFAAAG